MLCSEASKNMVKCSCMITRLLSLIAVGLLIMDAQAEIQPKVISVCKNGCDYTNISAGLDAAYPGQVIEVHSGKYAENVIVSKSVVVLGKDTGSGRPVIDAGFKGNGITIQEKGAAIKGFSIKNSSKDLFGLWAGIYVKSDDNLIENNIVVDNKNGIMLKGAANNTISENVALNNEFAVKVADSKNNKLSRNEIYNNKYGLYFTSSADNILRNNSIYDNLFNFGADQENDIDAGNYLDFKPIYFLDGVSDLLVDTASNAGVLYCFNCNNITVKDISLINNFFGIYLFNTTDSIFENITLFNNSCGIMMKASSSNSVIKCNINKSDIDGISMIGCEGNLLESNLVENAGNFGISISESFEDRISDNRLMNNLNGLGLIMSKDSSLIENNISINKNIGIKLDRSNFNSISNNELNANAVGLLLESSCSNNITANQIELNKNGLRLSSSNENAIIGNNISINGIALIKDLFDNNIYENRLLNNENDEDILLPGPTASFPGIRSPEIVRIEVESNPKNAIVSIDGKEKGLSNITINVLEGKHKLELSWRNGYYSEIFDTTNKTEFLIDGRNYA